MEDWQLDFEWLHVQHLVKDAMRKDALPDLNLVLMLIGLQELGRWKTKFTEEEKQDLMHIGVCRLLSEDGYYTFAGRDADGWPHYHQVLEMPVHSVHEQERILKINAILYFKAWEAEHNAISTES